MFDKMNFKRKDYQLHSVLSQSEPEVILQSRSRSSLLDAISSNACFQPVLGFVRERIINCLFFASSSTEFPSWHCLKRAFGIRMPREFPIQTILVFIASSHLQKIVVGVSFFGEVF